LAVVEAKPGLTGRPPLDLALVVAGERWARGAMLEQVLDADLAAGDFVRWAKQVVDLRDQLADAAPSARSRETARAGVHAVRRGIVAVGTVCHPSGRHPGSLLTHTRPGHTDRHAGRAENTWTRRRPLTCADARDLRRHGLGETGR